MTLHTGYDSPLSRRDAFGSMAATGGLGMAMMQGMTMPAHAAWTPDWDNPKDNLKAFVKLTARLDSKPFVGWYGGHVFGVVGQTDILKPLFGLEGFGVGQMTAQPDGTYKSSWKEIGLYKDMATDEIIETWTNPYIDEKVDVLHIQNEAVNSIIADHYPDLSTMAGVGEPGSLVFEMPNYRRAKDPARPFVLPWSVVGDTVSVWNDFRGRVKNVLDPKTWPRESAGEYIRVSESFLNTGSYKELCNDNPNMAATGAWNRLAPWLPWMLMGQSQGFLFYRCSTRKLEKFEELPPKILKYAEKNLAKYLDYNTPWKLPNESSFEVFKKMRKPTPPKVNG